MSQHLKIDYLEYPAKDIPATKAFFMEVFAWQFTDFGPEYTAFSNAGIKGGFYRSDSCSTTGDGAALAVFYSQELEETEQQIKTAGGQIIKPTFSFPGGRRFHFTDPNGNEFAVWSE